MLIGGIGDGAAAVAKVIELATFGGAVVRLPIGTAYGAADIVAIDAGAGHVGASRGDNPDYSPYCQLMLRIPGRILRAFAYGWSRPAEA